MCFLGGRAVFAVFLRLDISCTEIRRWNVDGPQKARMILQMRILGGAPTYPCWELVFLFQKDGK